MIFKNTITFQHLCKCSTFKMQLTAVYFISLSVNIEFKGTPLKKNAFLTSGHGSSFTLPLAECIFQLIPILTVLAS